MTPGFRADDLQVQVLPESVIVQGELKQAEASHKNLFREFLLPADVDANKIGAEFQNGTLTITLPNIETVSEPASLDVLTASFAIQ